MGIPTGNEGAQALCGCLSATAFIVATRLVATLWRIDSDQAVHGAIEAHGVAIDHVDWMPRDISANADPAALPRDISANVGPFPLPRLQSPGGGESEHDRSQRRDCQG